MYFVEKYEPKEHRWKQMYRGIRQSVATELVYTLSKAHPDRTYRMVILKKDTIRLFWPEVTFRSGEMVKR